MPHRRYKHDQPECFINATNAVNLSSVHPKHSINNKTLRNVHFGVAVVELIKCKCGGIVRNEIW